MEITVEKTANGYVAAIRMDDYADTARADRPGCAIRDLLNRFQYMYGKPAGDLTVTIEGW